MQISVAGVTDPGRIRFRNEDRYLLHPPMVAVADGMGGHLVGDRAAQAAVDSLARIPWRTVSTADAASLLQRCVAEARTYIVSYVKDGVLDTTETRVNAQPGAGTTLAGALYCVGEANWTVFHIGDSRVYLWRGGELRRLTRDHSLVQELIDEGEISEAQARYHPRRSVITRAIGSYGPGTSSWRARTGSPTNWTTPRSRRLLLTLKLRRASTAWLSHCATSHSRRAAATT